MSQKNNNLLNNDELIEKLGLKDLTKEKQEKMLESMNELLWKRIFLAIVGKLSENEAKTLNNYLEKNEYDEADKYLTEKVPDSIEILKKEVGLFQKELINRTC
jgi:polyhydroxyalkanoate synthesis regulator phasin